MKNYEAKEKRAISRERVEVLFWKKILAVSVRKRIKSSIKRYKAIMFCYAKRTANHDWLYDWLQSRYCHVKIGTRFDYDPISWSRLVFQSSTLRNCSKGKLHPWFNTMTTASINDNVAEIRKLNQYVGAFVGELTFLPYFMHWKSLDTITLPKLKRICPSSV